MTEQSGKDPVVSVAHEDFYEEYKDKSGPRPMGLVTSDSKGPTSKKQDNEDVNLKSNRA